MIEYYQKMLEKATNPKHKAYYKKMIKGNDPYKTKKKEFPKPQRVYSKMLDMEFDSMTEASRFLGCNDRYVYHCFSGHLKNFFGFIKI